MDDQESSDHHNFSQASSPAHRLPTLNGVQALFDAIEKHKPISTGVAGLDATLCLTDDAPPTGGGIPRGRLTEVYGAPGSGKTHFAIQLAANALRDDDDAHVVWIDTSSQVPFSRLRRFLQAPQETPVSDAPLANGVNEHGEVALDKRLENIYISSFPHLLALVLHPAEDFPPDGTSLLIIDGLSNITLLGLPQNDTISNRLPTTNGSLSRDDIVAKSIATRRAAMFSAISSGLARLAASRNIAVVVTNNTSSHRKQGGKTSVLRSALNSQQWNENVSTRIVIYRDFWPFTNWTSLDREEARKQRKREKWPLRIAEVEKLNGNEVSAEGTKFVILRVRYIQRRLPDEIELTMCRTTYVQLGHRN